MSPVPSHILIHDAEIHKSQSSTYPLSRIFHHAAGNQQDPHKIDGTKLPTNNWLAQ